MSFATKYAFPNSSRQITCSSPQDAYRFALKRSSASSRRRRAFSRMSSSTDIHVHLSSPGQRRSSQHQGTGPARPELPQIIRTASTHYSDLRRARGNYHEDPHLSPPPTSLLRTPSPHRP